MAIRFKRLGLNPEMVKAWDKAVALRTSALCRDAGGQLIVRDECQEDENYEIDDEAAAVVSILIDWSNSFTDAKLAALRKNGEK